MQHHQAIFFLLILMLAILAGEYAVYVQLDPLLALQTDDRAALVLLKLAAGAGVWCRLSFMICFLGWVMGNPGGMAGTGKKQIPGNVKLGVIIGFLLCVYFLLRVHVYPLVVIRFGYPAILCCFILTALLLPAVWSRRQGTHFGIRNEKKKMKRALGFSFRTRAGYINVPNPFRGIFISGAAGAGKSESLAFPIIQQAIAKGYTGLVYDFKFPVLAEQVHLALWKCNRRELDCYMLNFHDLSRSHRLNPLKAEQMPVLAFAEEYSLAILNNLLPETIRKKDFWIRSANALLSAVIWFLKKHHPQYCTLPHAVNIILYKDYMRSLSMLASDPETAGMARSVISAVENDAEGQIAGVIGSLQLSIARINSPEICWVLSGDDFELDMNNPDKPKLLVLGTLPTLVDTFSPLISCIITVALKQMNRPDCLPAVVLLDEAPTLYIPRLEMIPATARSNRIATVYMAQDYSQMVDSYGKEKADVIIANLNNQFYGRVGVASSARMISDFFGREEKEMESRSTSQNHWGGRLTNNHTISINRQEKQLVRPQDLSSLQVGEFLGTTVEGKEPYFWSRIRVGKAYKQAPAIQPFASNVQVEQNFKKIHAEAEQIVTSYRQSVRKPARGKRRA
ncbi:type IV secretory system conjugative DNA transfer family protein [Cesiribacter sp. SM1]|uniref:type IV secretory system conjugative DNA transfer family protein n=1 Tax=Cesiribacter sp. SM1 TaxID=2861196 RepID=UPI001CD2A092|nr:type IV secretory system conjugative DNA transfer family protein [Cesiribacter sp. SM1]